MRKKLLIMTLNMLLVAGVVAGCSKTASTEPIQTTEQIIEEVTTTEIETTEEVTSAETAQTETPAFVTEEVTPRHPFEFSDLGTIKFDDYCDVQIYKAGVFKDDVFAIEYMGNGYDIKEFTITRESSTDTMDCLKYHLVVNDPDNTKPAVIGGFIDTITDKAAGSHSDNGVKTIVLTTSSGSYECSIDVNRWDNNGEAILDVTVDVPKDYNSGLFYIIPTLSTNALINSDEAGLFNWKELEDPYNIWLFEISEAGVMGENGTPVMNNTETQAPVVKTTYSEEDKAYFRSLGFSDTTIAQAESMGYSRMDMEDFATLGIFTFGYASEDTGITGEGGVAGEFY